MSRSRSPKCPNGRSCGVCGQIPATSRERERLRADVTDQLLSALHPAELRLSEAAAVALAEEGWIPWDQLKSKYGE